jgi:hypothetical protein
LASPLRLPAAIAPQLAWRLRWSLRSGEEPLLPLPPLAVDVSLSPLRHTGRFSSAAAAGIVPTTGADLPAPAAAAAAARAAVALSRSADRECRTLAALLPFSAFEGEADELASEALLGESAADEENRLLCAMLWCGERPLWWCADGSALHAIARP